ncbi:hypothetical protein VB715_21315 [Crocosphaera sp. UHCC 0190]|uniref:hypothetical protein n=1 Tax=Crocosphaera sp. UHCC 0190 TaxID=3110246 RepID=UPI002B1F89AA|nr:hypothetical protein [Crocosphaera sp. UHCC 0190]MEA5512316.1 hypothetical protein [Crocosphaera sp. UHCC 0190]
MNTQLVDTLAQIINALTPEEKALLEEKTTSNKNKEAYQKMVEVREKILEKRGGKPLDMDVSEMIYQMREERSQELMDACFPHLSQPEFNIKE